MSGALILAGGGLAGIAWEIGVLAGISDADPALYAAITAPEVTYVGTSAGSAVASQLAGGATIEELFAQQIAEETAELGAEIDLVEFSATMASLVEGATTAAEARRRIGRFALDADTVSSADRRAVIAARLPVDAWPERRLLITAVDTGSGELRVFDRHSGVHLIDAVSASCAVPGVWPTVEIEGKQYMDGGTRTIANVDLAAGCDPVIILTPAPEINQLGPTLPPHELIALGDASVSAVFADDASILAFGQNPLDPSVRPPAARAGRLQGARIAAELARNWN
jgi:NTE family protein